MLTKQVAAFLACSERNVRWAADVIREANPDMQFGAIRGRVVSYRCDQVDMIAAKLGIVITAATIAASRAKCGM